MALLELPIRMQEGAGDEPVVSVDGVWGAQGLHLSHWPGNRTPRALKRDLSTGIVLAFARLSPEERAELAAGCVAVANNHLDTDGVCALFAMARPAEALAREEALLAAAAAGDFFRFPSDAALALDAIVTEVSDPEGSPWRARFAGLSDLERHELCLHALIERLPALLAGELGELEPLARPVVEAARADRADLAEAARDELVHLDLCVWTAPAGRRSQRAGAERFDPGRHALFGTSEADRALVLGPGGAGTSARLLFNTTSWFDLPGRRFQPRPDLAALAAALDAAEGTRGEEEVAWRAQDAGGASPELWFGLAGQPLFAEHNERLRPSGLDPARIKSLVLDALRAAFVFPGDGEE